MGLKIQRRVTTKARVITTLIAVFALLAQPVYGFVAGQVANAAGPAVINVSNSGNDVSGCGDIAAACKTISYAIVQASANDTVFVLPGTYAENVVINKDITLKAAHTDSIVKGRITVVAAGSGATIQSLMINSNTGDDYAVGVSGANNVTIYNNTISGTHTNAVKMSAKAIYVGDGDVSGIDIHGNYISAVKSDQWGAYGVLLNKKTFQNAKVYNNTIHNISGVWATGIGLEGNTPNATITGNKITSLIGTPQAVHFEDNTGSASVTLTGNTFNARPLTKDIANVAVNAGWAPLASSSAATEVLASDGMYHYYGLNAFSNLQDAVNAVSIGGVIGLDSNVATTQEVTIQKSVTLNGNSNTVFPTFSKTSNANNAAIGVEGNNVAINNLLVDGAAGTNLHGINVYQVSGITLDKVTSNNNDRSGLVVNGSKVTATDISTSGNGLNWNGIDVDQTGAELTVNGTSYHNEAGKDIFVDTRSVGIVHDIANQYNRVATAGDSYSYYLKSSAPSEPVLNSSVVYVNKTQANNKATWTDNDPSIVSYQYREYRNMTEADADVDGNTASYWTVNHAANDKAQTVGQSWTVDKTLYYRVVAYNADGNRSVSALGTVVIDKNVPTAIVNLPGVGPAATWFTVQFNEAVKKTDAENAKNYFLNNWKPDAGWSFSGSTGLEGQAVVKYDETAHIATVTLPSGWYISGEQQWGVRDVSDLAGNAMAAPSSAYSTPMQAPVDHGTPTPVLSTDKATINWSWTAATDGDYTSGDTSHLGAITYHYTMKRDGDMVLMGDTSATSLSTPVSGGGIYKLIVTATDLAMNTSTPMEGTITVDTLAPTLTINAPTLNSDGTYTVSGTTTDSTAPLTLTINNTPIVPVTISATPNTDGTWNWSANLGALNAKTLFTISVNSKDAASNVAKTATTSYTTPGVKTVALPQVPSTSSPSNGQTGGPSIVVPVSTVADPPTVLGTQTAKGSILAASDKVAAIAPSEQGWKIFGTAWYWWVLIVAAVAAIMWWIIAAARRHNQNA